MTSDKYKLARHLAPDYPHVKPVELYQHLYSKGFYWNSNVSWWVKKKDKIKRMSPNEVEIRITSDSLIIRRISSRIIQFLKDEGFDTRHLNSKNPPIYPCNSLETKRVYLTIRTDS